MNGRLNGWRETEILYEWRQKVKPLKTPLLGIFMRIKNDVSLQMLIFIFFIYIWEMFFTIAVYLPWPWLTEVQQPLPVSPESNGNVSLLFHSRCCGKTQNSSAAIDKFIMQSECTNSRFHHLAHQQLFPMNYLLAPLLLLCPLHLMW